jgi:hypothetical protein
MRSWESGQRPAHQTHQKRRWRVRVLTEVVNRFGMVVSPWFPDNSRPAGKNKDIKLTVNGLDLKPGRYEVMPEETFKKLMDLVHQRRMMIEMARRGAPLLTMENENAKLLLALDVFVDELDGLTKEADGGE